MSWWCERILWMPWFSIWYKVIAERMDICRISVTDWAQLAQGPENWPVNYALTGYTLPDPNVLSSRFHPCKSHWSFSATQSSSSQLLPNSLHCSTYRMNSVSYHTFSSDILSLEILTMSVSQSKEITSRLSKCLCKCSNLGSFHG